MAIARDLRERCIQRDVPLISTESEQIIEQILNYMQPQFCCEIGSAVAYSTNIIADTIQKRHWQLYSFEIAHNAYKHALEHTKHLTNTTIYPRSPLIIDLHMLIPKKCDFVFIDAQKVEYRQYFIKIQSLLHKESVVICDDVIKFQNKLDTLYWYLKEMQIFYTIIESEKNDGMMLIGEPRLINKILHKNKCIKEYKNI